MVDLSQADSAMSDRSSKSQTQTQATQATQGTATYKRRGPRNRRNNTQKPAPAKKDDSDSDDEDEDPFAKKSKKRPAKNKRPNQDPFELDSEKPFAVPQKRAKATRAPAKEQSPSASVDNSPVAKKPNRSEPTETKETLETPDLDLTIHGTPNSQSATWHPNPTHKLDPSAWLCSQKIVKKKLSASTSAAVRDSRIVICAPFFQNGAKFGFHTPKAVTYHEPTVM